MILDNKTVLITGASKGIGAAIAVAAAMQGANIVINYKIDDTAAKKILLKLKKYKGSHLICRADITNGSDVARMIEAVRDKYGHIDVLVNNVGLMDPMDGPDNVDVCRELFDVNFFSHISVTQMASKLMDKGKIVFISSIHAKLYAGRPDVIAYSSAKAALEHYAMNLSKFMAPEIQVNVVAPGRTATERVLKYYKDHQIVANIPPIGRLVKPDEVADVVMMLINDDAICGAVIPVDGGLKS